MTLRPIKLRLGAEEIHLVSARELERWGGFLNGRRGAHQLVTPDNVAELRHALMVARHHRTEAVFVELTKQLEDGSALFFEVPPEPVRWDDPEEIDIFDLIPDDADDAGGDRPTPQPGLHWIEVVCVSPDGGSYAGAKAQIRLPDGRSEYLSLDGRSSVRFDDLTEGGTAHFELSGDAVAHGTGGSAEGRRYELGAPVGLVTRKRHVLVVHPNPRAFVSVELVVEGTPETPVVGGRYTLSTKRGDQGGTLEGEPVRVDALMLPSAASYGFEGVVLPPRPADDPEDPEGPDPIAPDPDPDQPEDPEDPDTPEDPDVPNDPVGPAVLVQQLRVRLQGGEDIPVLVRYEGGRIETQTDAEGMLDVEIPEGLASVELLVPGRGEFYTLELQPLGSAASPRGAAHRLRNLGLYTGPAVDILTPLLRDAIRIFQKLSGVPVTAELDAHTAQALESAHGS